MVNKQRILKIFAALNKHNPYPTTELRYTSTFELLIAVMLSAQATDVSVNKATAVLFAKANTPVGMLELGLAKLEKIINSLGLYKTKAKHIMATCKQLVIQHNHVVPSTREQLEALPGVGRKTANVILNTAFNQPVIAVDTHIFRLAHRLRLSKGSTPLQVELDLERLIPQKYLLNAHHWLILHGRYVCKARTPLCHECLLANLCPSSL